MKTQNEKTFPSNGQDWFNYAAGLGVSNRTISIVLGFDGFLNEDLLERAVLLSLDADPILGCRFVLTNANPVFIKKPGFEAKDYFLVYQTEFVDDFLRLFLVKQIDDTKMVDVALFRSGNNDTLSIKLNHTCGDAGALKQYVFLLANIYSELEKDSTFVPQTKFSEDRTPQAVYKSLDIENPFAFFKPELGKSIPTWAFPFENETGIPAYQQSMQCFSPEEFARLYSYSKENRLTINDLILTSFFRNMFRVSPLPGDVEGKIDVTIDLRRYLSEDKYPSISNLSSMVAVALKDCSDDSFIESVKKVKKAFAGRLDLQVDLHNSIGCEYLGSLGYKAMFEYFFDGWNKGKEYKVCSPILSNIGIISRAPVLFGNNAVNNAYVVPPAFHAPALMLSASCYNNNLTLMSCYYSSEVNKRKMENFLDCIYSELREL
jgi:NRPS condensation-like uncharacterized protein